MTNEYFDALLKRALEESLRGELHLLAGGGPDVSALDRRMEKLLRDPHAYVRKVRRPWYIKALRAAAMFLLVCSVLVGLSALHPQVRAKYSDLIKTLFPGHNAYNIESDIRPEFPEKVKLGYIPEGYELETETNDSFGIFLSYIDDSDGYFSVSLDNRDASVHADSEHFENYSTAINGRIVDLYESTEPLLYANRLIAYDDSNEFVITIEGFIPTSELIEIFENIKY